MTPTRPLRWILALLAVAACGPDPIDGGTQSSRSALLDQPAPLRAPASVSLRLNNDLESLTELIFPKAADAAGFASVYQPISISPIELAKKKYSSVLFLCHQDKPYELMLKDIKLTNPIDRYTFDANVMGPKKVALNGAMWRTRVTAKLVFWWPKDDTALCATEIVDGLHVGRDYYFELPVEASDFELDAEAKFAAVEGALQVTDLTISKFTAGDVVIVNSAASDQLDLLIAVADGLVTGLTDLNQKLVDLQTVGGLLGDANVVLLPQPIDDVCSSGTSVANLESCLNSIIATHVLSTPEIADGLTRSIGDTLSQTLPAPTQATLNGGTVSLTPAVSSYLGVETANRVEVGVTIDAAPVSPPSCGAGATPPVRSGAGPAIAEIGDLDLVIPYDVVEEVLFGAARAGSLCAPVPLGTTGPLSATLSLEPAGAVAVRGPPPLQPVGVGDNAAPPPTDFTSSIPMRLKGSGGVTGALTLTLEIDWTLSTPCYGPIDVTASRARALSVDGSISVDHVVLTGASPVVRAALAALERNLPGRIGRVPLLPMPGQLPHDVWLGYAGKVTTNEAVAFGWSIVSSAPNCAPAGQSYGNDTSGNEGVGGAILENVPAPGAQDNHDADQLQTGTVGPAAQTQGAFP